MLLTNKNKLISSDKITNKPYFERRTYFRLKVIDFNINAEIKPSTEKKIFKAEVINIGNDGIMIKTISYLPIGEEISFKLKLPSPFNLIEGKGKIKWGLEEENKLYYGLKFNNFKDEIYTAQFYDFLNENSIKNDINELLKEKKLEEKTINITSNRIPKCKDKNNYERRKENRRKQQTIISFMDRRIDEQRKNNRRQNEEDRRKDKSSTSKEKRKNDRRKLEFLDYSREFIDHRRNWLSNKLNVNLSHIGSYSMNPQLAKGNIENMIGAAQIPIGIAGPCKINGEYAKGDFYIPLATTEGSLVFTFQWGMQAINLAGGANVKIIKNNVHISPVFLVDNINECFELIKWIDENFHKIKNEAEKTTRYGKLLSIEHRITGNKVILIFNYNTGDAAGQNMIAISADAACNYISQQTGYKFYLKSNFSSDKKASAFNYINGYGKSVLAEISISSKISKRILNVYPEEFYDFYKMNLVAGTLAGMLGINGHFANGVAAIFIACGQDVAHIANSHIGFTYCEVTKENNLYMCIYMPDLTVGTVGGGTNLGTQKEGLEILGCKGKEKTNKFTEIIAAVALAGELAIGSALTKGTFTQGHVRHGRV